MAVNWGKVQLCRIRQVLGVTECNDCPNLKECWGDESELPPPNREALEKVRDASNGSISTHKEEK